MTHRMHCASRRSILILSATFISLSSIPAGANQPPSVSDVSVSMSGTTVSIRFLVADPDDDSVNVTVTAIVEESEPGVWMEVPSRRYLQLPGDLTGDIGRIPLKQGTISWHFELSDPRLEPFRGRSTRIRVAADDGHPVDIPALLERIDSNALRADLRAIDGPRHAVSNPARLDTARTWLRERMNSLGALTSDQRFEGWNLTGDRPGVAASDTSIVIGGHYDTVERAPGADDNGSGVIGSIAALSMLRDVQFRRTIRMVAFDLEEPGLIGSNAYVQAVQQGKAGVIGALIMDMIGCYSDAPNSHRITDAFRSSNPAIADSIERDSSRGNFALVFTDAGRLLAEPLSRNARAYVPGLRILEAFWWNAISDHAPFWSAGIPAILLFDGAAWRSHTYHTPADTVGTIDFRFMMRNVRAAALALAELAQPVHAGVASSDAFELVPPSSVLAMADSRPRLSLSPNPTIGLALLRIDNAPAGELHITIVDALGRVVARFSDASSASSRRMWIDARRLGLTPGFYVGRAAATGWGAGFEMVVR